MSRQPPRPRLPPRRPRHRRPRPAAVRKSRRQSPDQADPPPLRHLRPPNQADPPPPDRADRPPPDRADPRPPGHRRPPGRPDPQPPGRADPPRPAPAAPPQPVRPVPTRPVPAARHDQSLRSQHVRPLRPAGHRDSTGAGAGRRDVDLRPRWTRVGVHGPWPSGQLNHPRSQPGLAERLPARRPLALRDRRCQVARSPTRDGTPPRWCCSPRSSSCSAPPP